jgi:hypothetical protein
MPRRALQAAHRCIAARRRTPLTLVHCRLDKLASAQRLFAEMRQQGCQPTHTTFIMLLQSAEAHGQAQVAAALLAEMQAMQLCLTPQCYSAAIGACAAAGDLATARKLLLDMNSGNKAGMAAPAHIIIQNQDKCCDWAGAFGTYQKLIASNVRPDKQTTAIAIEALWGAGHVGSCLLALKVFHASCKQGLFKADASVHPSEPLIEFVVPGAGTAMAIVGLWTLLVEMRAKVMREGDGFLCAQVVLLLGDGQAQMPLLKDAMAQVCLKGGGRGQQLRRACTHCCQCVLRRGCHVHSLCPVAEPGAQLGVCCCRLCCASPPATCSCALPRTCRCGWTRTAAASARWCSSARLPTWLRGWSATATPPCAPWCRV